MLDQLASEIEQKVSRLRRNNNVFTKKCMVVPSIMRHSNASIVHSKRKSGSSRTIMTVDGASYEIAHSFFNLMFLKHWFEWSFGVECDAFDKLGSGQDKKPTFEDGTGDYSDVGLYELFSSSKSTYLPNIRPFWTCLSGLPLTDFPSKRPSMTGYWKSKPEAGSLGLCVLQLERWRFSYTINKEVLYFSNSLSASFGLPPNAELLRYPRIQLLIRFDNFGGLVPAGDKIGEWKEKAVEDLMGLVAGTKAVTSADCDHCRLALQHTFLKLDWGRINRFCFDAFRASDKFEGNQFLLWLDVQIRKIARESVF